MTVFENSLENADGASVVDLTPEALFTMLTGANTGLAIFDEDLNLSFANEQYIVLCGYEAGEARLGTNLRDLVGLSMQRAGFDPAVVQDQFDRGLDRLRKAGGFSFRFRTREGRVLFVHRRVLQDGRISEIVEETEQKKEEDIGEQRLELMVEAARSRMAHALESMADGFALFDSDDRLVLYNQRYVALNSHIADVVAPGRKYEEMLRIGMERGGYETSGLGTEEFVQWRLEQHRNPKEAYDLLMHDGRWIRVQERRTHDGGTVGTRTDITELKHREAEILSVTNELRRKHMQFDTALNNMVQGLCMFDADQTLMIVNRRYLEMYGFSADVVKPGIKLHEIMEYSISIGNYTKEDAARALAERPDHAKRRQSATLKQYLRDGRVIAVMHEPMPDGGSIATYQDITDLERHEAELQQYTKKLEASNRELQDFAYVASHDLQEPLRKIETFGERLVSKYADEMPEGARKFIDRMDNAIGRMRQLINDLLAYSRVTTKAKPFVKVDLQDVLDGVLGDLQVRLEETEAIVECNGLPTIDADPTQMRQLLQNILSNALKFQPPERKPHVRVTSTIHEGNFISGEPEVCEIRIADNGIGFDNKYKDQIFTIFQRLHGRNEYEGTGIGLATVRKIVDRHEGDIDADGKDGVGATFIISLPMTQKQIDQTNETETADV